MENIVFDKIIQIEKDLDIIWKNEDNLSLLNGIGGLPIFYYMLYKLTTDNIYLEKMNNGIEILFDKLNTSRLSYTYCDGLTGIAFMLEFLKKQNILNYDISETIELIDNAVINYALRNTQSYDDVDFLHGSLGIAFYFIEKLPINESTDSHIIKLIKRIGTIIKEDILKTKCVCNLQTYDDLTHRTNVGLAHGHISSIIIFSKYLEKFPEDSYIREILADSVSCVLDFKSDDDSTPSAFPGISINRHIADYRIHMGWCYGDQSTALGFFKASKVLNDTNLEIIAKNLAYRTLKRDTILKALKSEKRCDAGFCHGVSSLSYIHKKFFKITKDAAFQKAYEMFLDEMIKMGSWANGIGGYKKFAGENKFERAIGMLSGSIGIGIVLIDYLLDDENVNWESVFLLD